MTYYFKIWDPELEAIAQRWAEQCQSGHDTNQKKLDETLVGQNIAWSFSSNEPSVQDTGVMRDTVFCPVYCIRAPSILFL